MLDRVEKWGRAVAAVLAPIGLVYSAVNGLWFLATGFALLLVALALGYWSRRKHAAAVPAGDAVEWSPDLVREVVDGAESRAVGVRRIRVADRSLSLLDAVKLYDEAVLGR